MNDLVSMDPSAPGAINCVDDVVDILDAVTHDLFTTVMKGHDASALCLREEEAALLHVSEAEATRTVLELT